MNYRIVLLSISLLGCLLPRLSNAETTVSQTFDRSFGGTVVYVDVGTEKKYLVIDDTIYQSSTFADSPQTWQSTGQSVDFSNDIPTEYSADEYLIDHDFTTAQTILFNEAAYVTVEMNVYVEGLQEYDYVTTQQQIWRISVTDNQLTLTKAFNQTDDISDGDHEQWQLATLDNKLYALSESGKLYYTKNDDTTWKRITNNLPKTSDYTLYADSDQLYVGLYNSEDTTAALYTSQTGSRWALQTGSYQIGTGNGTEDSGIKLITSSRDRLYLTIQHTAGTNSVWSKKRNTDGARWKRLFKTNYRTIGALVATNKKVTFYTTSAYGIADLNSCDTTLDDCDSVWLSYEDRLITALVSRRSTLYIMSPDYTHAYLMRV